MTIQQNLIQDLLEKFVQDLKFLITDPINFFDTYFFSAPGYNLYNTITYTIVGILSILLIGKIIITLNKRGNEHWGEEHFIPVQMDSEFFISILPFIFIGSTLRALQDIADQNKIISPYEIFADRLFVTPGVYIVTIFLTLTIGIVSIFGSQEYLKSVRYFSNWRFLFFVIGVIIESILIIPIFFLLTDFNFIFGGTVILILTGIFGVVFHVLTVHLSQKYIPNTPIRKEEKLAMITQMFDAINTVIAIEFFGYQEKHYLPALLFNTPLGSLPFLLIKFIIVWLFIWAVRGIKKDNLERWLLWVVFLLGLATGTRDFLRLVTNT